MSEHINLADIRTAILRAKDRNETPTLITISYEDFILLYCDDEFMLNLGTDKVDDCVDYKIFGIDLYADRFRPAGYLKIDGMPCARTDFQGRHCPDAAKYRPDYQVHLCDACYAFRKSCE